MPSDFRDSPALAKRDAQITDLHYEPGEFRQYFTTPFEQYAAHIGKPFEVVKQLPDAEPAEEGGEGEDMYLIRFEDGTEIEAWGHEVCVLDYEHCKPRLPAVLPEATAYITVEVTYDPATTDPDAIAKKVEAFLDNTVSTEGIWDDCISDEYGSPGLGEVYAASKP